MDNATETTSVSETSSLRFAIELFENGVKVKTLHTRKYGRIVWLARNRHFDTANLTVRYGDFHQNGGDGYEDAEELLRDLRIFTEPDLLAYLAGH